MEHIPGDTDHFITGPGYPTTKSQVRNLTDRELNEFMAECGIEPADFDNCLACYAYQVLQEREQAWRTNKRIGVWYEDEEGDLVFYNSRKELSLIRPKDLRYEAWVALKRLVDNQ